MKAFRVFDKVIKVILLIITVVMTCLGMTQILTRYVFHYSLSWCEEVTRYLFIWTTFIGVPIGIYEGRHATIDFISRALSDKSKNIYDVILLAIEAGICVVMLFFGYTYAVKNLTNLATTTRIPMTYVIASVPVCGLEGIIYCIATACEKLKKKGAPE